MYLNKKDAAVNALKDYGKMKHIIDHTDEEIQRVYSRIAGVGSPAIEKMPSANNPQAGEDRMIKGIEEIDVLRERLRQAKEYMAWFQPAWDALSDDDQFVLDAFFSGGNEYGAGAADTVAEHFCIERASAYRKKNRALDNLTTLLYGRW
jgi:hypothetical protein